MKNTNKPELKSFLKYFDYYSFEGGSKLIRPQKVDRAMINGKEYHTHNYDRQFESQNCSTIEECAKHIDKFFQIVNYDNKLCLINFEKIRGRCVFCMFFCIMLWMNLLKISSVFEELQYKPEKT
ncbi:hypothetical protein BpHYR1_023065 [Brachionus plicatilis]|uniref:Uncharacterized protein n=1 Tax=Brachionus plicatilis TaxID=10195 RepID=A0A3M7SIN2_BRAPC|nr:hypothetical protein BpHYR1_023065 [Brachionus plicatilis]